MEKKFEAWALLYRGKPVLIEQNQPYMKEGHMFAHPIYIGMDGKTYLSKKLKKVPCVITYKLQAK